MIRLVSLLCVGLYFGLLVLGQDHGQKRHGLTITEAPLAPSPVQPTTEVVFIPAQPVMQQVATAPSTANNSAVTLASGDAAPQVSAALPEPDIPGGTLFTVASSRVNVRQGPGTDHAVVGSLSGGEQVLVVLDHDPVEGWSHVRLEGDGIEGYVATRFLIEVGAAD